jgi:acetyl-CoA synthetase
MNPTDTFARARDLLLRHRGDYEAAYREFQWPALDRFNWALDWFDVLAKGNRRTALKLVRDEGAEEAVTFAGLSERSTRVAEWLSRKGVARGDRVLVMLGNVLPLWETMLGAFKIGAVVVPASQQLPSADLEDRITRGGVRHAVCDPPSADRFAGAPSFGALRVKLVVGGALAGWTPFDEARAGDASFRPPGQTNADDPLLLYFTSGTTARPKLVLHTHRSYPVGHLSTMYWIGLREGDVHQNISSPGWAKHAWSSFFSPWNAGATLLMHDTTRFRASRQIEVMREHAVTTMCCPPTVWRMIVLEQLGGKPAALRELVSAGEPLNPEVIEHVRRDWGITIRDGYGQTETTAQVGNSPGQPVKLGSMGRPLPGFRIALLGHDGREANEGELAIQLDPRPAGLMTGYADDPRRTEAVMSGGYYRTGDEASRDGDGYYHYVGRADDVFKSSDYRISPFELESVLIEHPLVAEAAVIPSPDPLRLAVPKAYVVLKSGAAPGADTARDILVFCRGKLAAFKRIRRIEFAELPKTISGKIRRVQLRAQDSERRAKGERGPQEYWWEDFDKAKDG